MRIKEFVSIKLIALIRWSVTGGTKKNCPNCSDGTVPSEAYMKLQDNLGISRSILDPHNFASTRFLEQAIVFAKEFIQSRGRFTVHLRVLLADDLNKKFKLSPTDVGLVIDVALKGIYQKCPTCQGTELVLTKKGVEVKKLFDALSS
ncbi:hypothetical protein QTV49_004632 [Vibrio vulnificus]|nr:hypothetical protein [Vibrio vulnificus]